MEGEVIESVQERISRNAEAIFTPREIIELNEPIAVHEYTAETPDGPIVTTRTIHRTGRDGSGGGFKAIEYDYDVPLEHLKIMSREQSLGLAALMTLKSDLVDLSGMLPDGRGEDFGGAKGVMYVPRGTLSSRDKMDDILHDYVVEQSNKGALGIGIDRHAPDMNTGSHDMRVMAEALVNHTGDERAMAAFSGKPLEYGGLRGREIATGQGLVYTLANHLQALDRNPRQITVSVQGSGNVGYHFAHLAAKQLGVKIVGISDQNGAVVTDRRHPLRMDKSVKFENRLISDWDDTKHQRLSNPDDLLDIDADVFVFAAMPNAITEKKDNKHLLRAPIILQGANNPIDTAAMDYYLAEGRSIVADVLGNAGGFVTSNMEYNQGTTGAVWSKRATLAVLKRVMDNAYLRVYEEAHSNPINMVDPAFRVALKHRYDRDGMGSDLLGARV